MYDVILTAGFHPVALWSVNLYTNRKETVQKTIQNTEHAKQKTKHSKQENRKNE